MMTEPSSSPTNRFVPVSTHHLTAEPPLSETTLQSLLERSERLADEAKEALPYSFDECTYNKGYLRQSVWSCVECGEKGVCYGCSISCHAEHKLVELWTRRNFRCDCPTTSMGAMEVEAGGKRRKCTLNPPEQQPQQPNEDNKYGPNYAGKFCRCGREYDAETETEAMLNCIACEDWFHESCLNLLSIATSTISKPAGDATTNGGENEDDDDDDEKVLIPSNSYDGLICAACVRMNPFIEAQAGQEGYMIIEPKDDGSLDIVGKKTNEEKPYMKDTSGKDEGPSNNPVEKKRSAEETQSEPAAKKIKVEEAVEVRPSSSETNGCRWKGKGDVFLARGVREQLKSTLPPDVAKSLTFPLEDEEIYEPPQDADDGETIEQVTERVVGTLPRVQAIEALHGYQTMKDKLKTMLAGHAAEGRTVSREDIEGLFEQLQAGRASARG